jgi:hypothetical protein
VHDGAPDVRASGAVALCEAIGVIDSARPRPGDVSSILRAIPDGVTGKGARPTRWADAARWAMRELDSSLAKEHVGSEPGLDGTPLLASIGGELVSEAQPYVSEDELPIFQGDRDLTRVIGHFRLPKLEDTVRTTPIVAGLSDADTRRLRAHFGPRRRHTCRRWG